MRRWRRATSIALSCGLEMGCEIPPHTPYLELSGPGWTKTRCEKHAGEPVPVEIPEDVPPPRPMRDAVMASSRSLANSVRMGPKMLKFDARQAQTGERDE